MAVIKSGVVNSCLLIMQNDDNIVQKANKKDGTHLGQSNSILFSTT